MDILCYGVGFYEYYVKKVFFNAIEWLWVVVVVGGKIKLPLKGEIDELWGEEKENDRNVPKGTLKPKKTIL